MKEVKEINIKSAYHYFKDIVNIKDFHSNLLNIEKKSHKDIDISYIGYIMIKITLLTGCLSIMFFDSL